MMMLEKWMSLFTNVWLDVATGTHFRAANWVIKICYGNFDLFNQILCKSEVLVAVVFH